MAKEKLLENLSNSDIFYYVIDKELTFENNEVLEVRNHNVRNFNFLLHNGEGFLEKTREETIAAIRRDPKLIKKYKLK